MLLCLPVWSAIRHKELHGAGEEQRSTVGGMNFHLWRNIHVAALDAYSDAVQMVSKEPRWRLSSSSPGLTSIMDWL